MDELLFCRLALMLLFGSELSYSFIICLSSPVSQISHLTRHDERVEEDKGTRSCIDTVLSVLDECLFMLDIFSIEVSI